MGEEVIRCCDVSNVAGNDLCKFATFDLEQLEKHVQRQHENDEKRGDESKEDITSETILALKGPLSCLRCKNFLNKPLWRIRKHLQTHTKEGWFKCNMCKKTFPDSWHLKVHKRIHTGERPHSCFYCEKSYPDLSKLKRHLQSHQNLPSEFKCQPHECPLCGKIFDQKYKLRDHTNHHNGVKPFKCAKCTKSFLTKSKLKCHQTKHNEKNLECVMCTKKFADLNHLAIHISKHKSFECSACPFTTIKKVDLQKHARTHNINKDEKLKPCLECGKTFNVSGMKKHMKTHTRKCISTITLLEMLKGSAPCSRCKKYISEPTWKMRKHIRAKHTKEGCFKCETCERQFIDAWHLREHERSHTGEKQLKSRKKQEK